MGFAGKVGHEKENAKGTPEHTTGVMIWTRRMGERKTKEGHRLARPLWGRDGRANISLCAKMHSVHPNGRKE